MNLIENQPTEAATESIQDVTQVIEQYLDIINQRPDSDQCWEAIQGICKDKRPN